MLDSSLGVFYGGVTLAVGVFTALLIEHLFPQPLQAGRNAAVDGLRGYLAFGVFIYHAAIWRFYLRAGAWAAPTEVYVILGANCVKVFFMITAYLFVGKLIDSRQRPVDWTTLFLSRVLRLTPLYLAALAVMLALVGALSGWMLRQPVEEVLSEVMPWLAFSLFGTPDLNGVQTIPLLGVTWSLAYGWLFYLSLPLLAICMRRQVPMWLVVVATAALILLAMNKPDLFFPFSFLTGALAAAITRIPIVSRLLRRPPLAAVFYATAAMAFTDHGLIPKLVSDASLALAFLLVASGNSAWGLLENRVARRLGEMSYGLYLLHCPLLAIVFRFVVGTDQAARFDEGLHWAVISATGALLVCTAAVSYRWIEKPSIDSVPRIRQWIRTRQLALKVDAAG